jgi:hypothetical protein
MTKVSPLSSVKQRISALSDRELRNEIAKVAHAIDTAQTDACYQTRKSMLFLLHYELAERFNKRKGA